MVLITERQQKIYDLVSNILAKGNDNPSRDELTLLISSEFEEISRKNSVEVPVIGKVAAGSPIYAEEHFEKKLSIDPSFFDFTPDYFLRVSGCSMINAGILDGDLIAVKKVDGSSIRNGEIVIARVNHSDVTVKRYQRDGNTVWLIPENNEMSPIMVNLEKDDLEIDGVYVGLMRS
ncbi:MAG: transcriptional repressor LexA [Succinivibrionaceae bacterium]